MIGTIYNPTSQWILSFNIFYFSSPSDRWGEILRCTRTNNKCCDYGDRVPTFFTDPDGLLLFVSGTTENGNHNIHDVEKLNANREYMVRVVAVGDKATIYVNGVEKGSLNQHYSTRPQGSPLSVWAAGSFGAA